ncbi:MAG: peptigoglycan-binding protein LysM [Gammaproteobacteria bacterium]|nr:MAG: peptigoglycan-binding protein LysM [Gammaproteobacteria bacterium]RKZ96641.1 MAG: peptigoglycan-binding protein LysM [Gammaproteobacteria bacterium]
MTENERMLRVVISIISGLLFTSSYATTFDLVDENTRVVGHNLVVYSHEEDTLLDIARQFDLGYSEIVNANPDLDPWLPGGNQRVLVPNRFILPDAPKKGIVINLAEMRLYYYPKPHKGKRQQVITHPIGVGREGWTTPLGKTQITQKKKDPTWTPPASILAEHLEKGDPLPKVVPAGPDNPLGAYAMRLAMPGYLLHGTNRPYGVGLRVSHGCIRLFPEDIEHLFGIVPVNTPVEILYQPYKAAFQDGQLYLEAHKTQDDVGERKGNNMTPMVSAILKAQDKILDDDDWPFAEDLVRKHDGVVRPVNQHQTDIIEDIWFVHAGITQQAKKKLRQALVTLKSNEHFWPLRGAAEGEILLGPFDNQEQAQQMGRQVNRLTDMSVWTALVSNDVL